MTETQPDPVAPTNEDLLEIIEQYHERIDRGESVDRDAFVADHPDHRDGLPAYFDDLNVVESLAGPTVESATEGTMITGETHNGVYAETMVQTSQSDTSNARVAADAPRTKFGRYRLLKELGRGAMGAVYLAHDEQLDREIALKIPQFGQDMDPALLERFYREARAAAALRHPGICPVFDVGEIDGQHYITMAFIKGRPLRDFTKTTKTQGIRQVVRVIRKLAMAMAEAHKHNVTHRDLKPANVMIDERKEPVVMDFGLARRAAEGEEKLTHSGTVIGTPAYMSPEQVDGDNDRVGPPADIYSLGVMFYEMLTGQLPFQGNLMSILKQIANDEPQPPSELRAEVPSELEAICLRMMAKQIEHRYQSMEQVSAALTEFLKQKNVGTEESGLLETSKPPAVHPKVLPQVEATEPVTVPPAPQPAPVEASLPNITPDLSATTVRSPRQSSGGIGKRNLWIAGGLGGVALLLAGIAFIVQLGKVTVQITVDDPSLALRVDGDEVVIEGDGAPIRLSAGTHELIVKREGLEFSPKEFKVTKDGKNAIHVMVIEGDVRILTDGKRPPTRDDAGTQVASALPAAAGPVDLERGLVGHWNFEEGDGTEILDSSGNGNHGTLMGDNPAAAWTSDVPSSQFSGLGGVTLDDPSEKVELSTSPSLEVTGQLSITAWVKLVEMDGKPRELFLKGENAGIRLRSDGLFVLAAEPGTIVGDILNEPRSDLPINKWFHLLARYDGQQMEVFVNGRRETSRKRSGPVYTGKQKVRIGERSSSRASFDDIRFYNRALTDAEIAVLAGKASLPESGSSAEPITTLPDAEASKIELKRGLMAQWSFEEGSGDQVEDLSGTGHVAAIRGPNPETRRGDDSPPVTSAGEQCLSVFAREDFAETDNWAGPDLKAGLTLSGWVWNGSDRSIVERSVVDKGGNLCFRLSSVGTFVLGTSSEFVTMTGHRTFVPVQRWYHVAATYDGSMMRLYVDADEKKTQPHSEAVRITSSPVRIGRISGSDVSSQFRFDDVRIYNRALSAPEIAVLAGKASVPADSPTDRPDGE